MGLLICSLEESSRVVGLRDAPVICMYWLMELPYVNTLSVVRIFWKCIVFCYQRQRFSAGKDHHWSLSKDHKLMDTCRICCYLRIREGGGKGKPAPEVTLLTLLTSEPMMGPDE